MKLSIIIPVFNEEKTVGTLLKKIINIKLKDVEKEVVVVDDGSTDSSPSKIKNQKSKIKNFKVFFHAKNQGKGAAIRTGLKNSTGDYIIIQDADLEYDPKQIQKLLKPIFENKAKVVYGTRLRRFPNFKRDESTLQFFLHYIGNKFLSLVTSVLYFQWITDVESGYKLFPKKALENTKLYAKGFEFEPEITIKLIKQGHKIFEVPISTKPRNYKQGKKLYALREGPKALWVLLKHRFFE